MEATLAEIKEKVIRVLADEVMTGEYGEPLSGAIFSADLLLDAICAALNAITVRVWKSEIVTIDGGVTEYEMPGDLLGIEGVYDLATGLFLPQMCLKANMNTIIGIERNAWTNYPEGMLTFVNELDGDGATLYYSATWTKPEEDNNLLDPPESTTTAIILYAASYCLLNQASGSANIRQYATKIDAGQPTDIPAKDMSDFFLRRFNLELQGLPTRQKGIVQ